MTTLEERMREFLAEPGTWLGFDEETRHLLKKPGGNSSVREYDEETQDCPSIMA